MNDSDLTDVEQMVIEYRFGLGGCDVPLLTLEQVAKVMGVTKERVRQIQNKALDKIHLAAGSTAAAQSASVDPAPRSNP